MPRQNLKSLRTFTIASQTVHLKWNLLRPCILLLSVLYAFCCLLYQAPRLTLRVSKKSNKHDEFIPSQDPRFTPVYGVKWLAVKTSSRSFRAVPLLLWLLSKYY